MLLDQDAGAGAIASPEQGLAHMLRQGFAGYLMGEDARNRSAAMGALSRGLMARPWVDPDTGAVSTSPAGGIEGAAAALGGLDPSNEYGAEMLQNVAVQKAQQDHAARLAETARRQALADAETKHGRALDVERAKMDLLLGRDDRKAATNAGYRMQQDAIRNWREENLKRAELGMSQLPPPTAGAGDGSARTPLAGQLGSAPPGNMADAAVALAGRKEGARQAARLESKREEQKSKVFGGFSSLVRKSETLKNNIDKALAAVSGWSTGLGNIALSRLPNTQARELENYLTTIKANIGFDRLQEMRDNSPTGGALGQVSELENRLLQATQGALDPLQRDQLVDNLKIIRDTYDLVLEEKRRAMEIDYGAGALEGLPPIKAAPPSAPSDEDLLRKYGG